MKRLLLTLVAVAALGGCGTTLKRAPKAEPASPVKPPAIICAKIEDEPAPDGGYPRPIGAQAIEAVRRLNDAEIEVRGWARRGWYRAKVAQEKYCR